MARARRSIDVSFTVAPATFTALLGLNGAGKSTLFSLITRLFGMQAGRIGIFGHDVGRRPGRGVAAARRGVPAAHPRSRSLGDAEPALSRRAARHRRPRSAVARRRGARAHRACRPRRRARCAISPAGRCGASRSPARCCIGRACCCSTSRRSVSTSRPAPTSSVTCARLVAEQGIGVLWATHLIDEIAAGRRPRGPASRPGAGARPRSRASSREAGAPDIRSAFMQLTGRLRQSGSDGVMSR